MTCPIELPPDYCTLCKHPTPVQHGSKYCKWHNDRIAKEEKALEKIKPVADKRKEELKEYRKQNREYAGEGNICAAFHLHKETGIRCSGIATTTNHTKGRENNRLLTKDDRNRLCLRHHIWVTEHTADAMRLGLMESKHKIKTETT